MTFFDLVDSYIYDCMTVLMHCLQLAFFVLSCFDFNMYWFGCLGGGACDPNRKLVSFVCGATRHQITIHEAEVGSVQFLLRCFCPYPFWFLARWPGLFACWLVGLADRRLVLLARSCPLWLWLWFDRFGLVYFLCMSIACLRMFRECPTGPGMPMYIWLTGDPDRAK